MPPHASGPDPRPATKTVARVVHIQSRQAAAARAAGNHRPGCDPRRPAHHSAPRGQQRRRHAPSGEERECALLHEEGTEDQPEEEQQSPPTAPTPVRDMSPAPPPASSSSIPTGPEASAPQERASQPARPTGNQKTPHHAAPGTDGQPPRLRVARIGAHPLDAQPDDLAQKPRAAFTAGQDGWWTCPQTRSSFQRRRHAGCRPRIQAGHRGQHRGPANARLQGRRRTRDTHRRKAARPPPTTRR